MTKFMQVLTRSLTAFLIVGGILVAPAIVSADTNYSDGNYGDCAYNSCGITLTSSGSVNLDVTPASGSTKCTVAGDAVQVLSDSVTGYTLTMSDTDGSANLDNGAGSTIATSSGTQASPSTLTTNSWGYRVDSIGGFGAGPTSSGSNTSTPGSTFAGIPILTATADTLATSSSPANPAVTTNVWYGLCVNTTPVSGSYGDSVVYTAVVN